MSYQNYNAPPGSRAIILTRVSSEGQRDNTSHEGQFQSAMTLLEREQWVLYKRYEETESGAYYEERAETQKALEDLEADNADVLVLYDNSRYGRDIEYQFKMLRRILRAGKWLQFTDLRLEYTEDHDLTEGSTIMLATQAGVSATERVRIRKRMMQGHKSLLDKGVTPYVSIPAFGFHGVTKSDIIRGQYTAEQKGKYFQVPEKAAIAHQLFMWTLEGLTENDIRKRLHERGIPSPTGKPYWQKSTIHGILTNKIYKGQPTHRRTKSRRDPGRKEHGFKAQYAEPRPEAEHVAMECEPIVSDEVWDEVQIRLAENKTKLAGRPSQRRLLSGLARCPECGRAMLAQRMHGYISYRCAFKNQTSEGIVRKCDNQQTMLLSEVEDYVIRGLLYAAQRPEHLRALIDSYKEQPSPAPAVIDIKELKARLDTVKKNQEGAAMLQLEARKEGSDDTVYREQVKRFSAERVKLESEIGRIEGEKAKATQKAPAPPSLISAKALAKEHEEAVAWLASSPASASEKNKLLSRIVKVVHPFRKLKRGPLFVRLIVKSPFPGFDFEYLVSADAVEIKAVPHI